MPRFPFYFLIGLQNSCQFQWRPSSRPGEMIVLYAADQDANFIVVGARGHSKLRLALTGGGVSDYVARNAHCPVIVCRSIK
jgi:nucleotide-binding universal stress UspA family protein